VGIRTQAEGAATVASGASTRTASEQFTQLAVTASQAIEAERSLVVSTFEEQEHQAPPPAASRIPTPASR